MFLAVSVRFGFVDLWLMAPYPIGGCQCFRGTCHLHIQGKCHFCLEDEGTGFLTNIGITTHQTKWCLDPLGYSLSLHCQENLKSCPFWGSQMELQQLGDLPRQWTDGWLLLSSNKVTWQNTFLSYYQLLFDLVQYIWGVGDFLNEKWTTWSSQCVYSVSLFGKVRNVLLLKSGIFTLSACCLLCIILCCLFCSVKEWLLSSSIISTSSSKEVSFLKIFNYCRVA